MIAGAVRVDSLQVLAGPSRGELPPGGHVLRRPGVPTEEGPAGGEGALNAAVAMAMDHHMYRCSLPHEPFLWQHILFCIIDSGCKSRDVLQSYFDLLGELMKFNIDAFQRFNRYVNTEEKVCPHPRPLSLPIDPAPLAHPHPTLPVCSFRSF